MKKKIVIFGASVKGIEALNSLKEENVIYFCDNDWEKIGTRIEGIEVICIHSLCKIKNEVKLVIASSYQSEIELQLRKNDIYEYEVYSEFNKNELCLNNSIKKNMKFESIKKIFMLTDSLEEVKKIKIRFIFQRSLTWKAVESVYCSFVNDNRFDVKIIVVPNDGIIEHKILNESNINYILYDEFNLTIDQPDIIICNETNDISRPMEYHSKNLCEISKLVYIQGTLHNLALPKKWIQDQMDRPIYKNAWKVILGDKEFYELCNISINKAFLTSPRWDSLYIALNNNNKAPKQWIEKCKKRKVILWNPHFYIRGQNSSTFDIYLKDILELVINNKELCLIIRPHPILFKSIYENNIWSKKQINCFKEFINKSENIILDEMVDYTKSFSLSDALISDMSTFLVTYLPIKKPILYLKHPLEDELCNKEYIQSYCDIASNFDYVKKFFEMIINNRDCNYKKRIEIFKEKVKSFDGKAGEKVKEYIVDEYYKEIELKEK
ncbi:CDP-glycerol glycerophosphotransferase family protein [uncultured Clostridium sp.]|uniref:CDP-glycerol glycerophosphotransferase family protein n=1 Tax=uncultured Clostridium sp. TaxID=59620 RepID=UPI0028E28450|nr:CDP-glycerol glycerophosphotransferase family protein [uncultured Clostridium sp.]